MAHHVYTTEAFVIESSPQGEANRSYLLFTQELGMIRATAQGVRLVRSKLRFSLQEFSVPVVSLVRGKEIWRITNAKAEHNLALDLAERKESLFVVAQIFSLLKRLMPGEEKSENLFGYLKDACDVIRTTVLEGEKLKAYEIIVVLNILHALGYLAVSPDFADYIATPITMARLESFEPIKASALREINHSLRETQL